MLIISTIQALYIFYMFNTFKTKYSFNHPFESLFVKNFNFLKHPYNSGNYENKICKLGNIYAYFLFLWLIFRNFIPIRFKLYIKNINSIIFNLTFLASLFMNFNAFLYFLPIFIIEKKYSNY